MACVRKLVVATGASSGLGFEALQQLLTTCPASTSYTVLLGCRDPSSVQAAYSALRPPIHTRHFILTHELDLRRLASVRMFAERVRNDIERTGGRKLDVLLLCAGISKAASPAQASESVWSEAYRVNSIAHQYLLHLLEDQLADTRIAVVSSMLYKSVKDTTALHDTLSSTSTASAMSIYKATKFVQLLQTLQWRERLGQAGRGSQVVAVSPGFVPETGLSRENGAMEKLLMRYVMPWAPFATTLQDGGRAILRAMIEAVDTTLHSHVSLDKSGAWDNLDPRVLDESLQREWWLSMADIEALEAEQVAE